MSQEVRKIAIFGGTFDPPHLAHRALIQSLVDQRLFDEIVVVPSHFPPGKTAEAAFDRRLHWTSLTFQGVQSMRVSDFERKTDKTLFGSDIYAALSHEASTAAQATHFYWILGSDQWEQLPYWNAIDTYGSAVTWIVLRREPDGRVLPSLLSRRFQKTTCAYQWASTPFYGEVSSSSLRRAIREEGANAAQLKWICDSIKDEVIQYYAKGERH